MDIVVSKFMRADRLTTAVHGIS